jgi:hypothetical protein
MHKEVDQHDFDWIYSLSNELAPSAKKYFSEDRERDIRAYFPLCDKIRLLEKEHAFKKMEAKCKRILRRYPLSHQVFYLLVCSYVKQNRFYEALLLVDDRMSSYIKHPFKVSSRFCFEKGFADRVCVDEKHGWSFIGSMATWISDMRALANIKADLEDKINRGYVYRPRAKK